MTSFGTITETDQLKEIDLHYYQFNIGDYTSHTARLSITEDLAYRRILDLYYLNERPLNGCSKTVAREIGMADYADDVEYILNKFFILNGDYWHQSRADKEIAAYKAKQKAASKAGKASAKARQSKGSEQTFNDRSTTVQPNNKHKPLNSNDERLTNNDKPLNNKQKPDGKSKDIVELKPDESQEIFKFWQSMMNHPRSAFDDKRKALIKKQLKNYSKGDLIKAITGCSRTPHNMGDNDRGERYDSIELILRDSKQIDRFMHNCDNPPTGKVVTIEQTQSRAQQQADRIKQHLGWNDE